MTIAQFRKEALAVLGAVESAHMGHADFRVHGKIFATVGYPDDTCAMVKLTPDQQQAVMRTAPKVFGPAKGAWGKQGSTKVNLATATTAVVRPALATAAQNIREKYPRPAGFNP